MVNSTTRVDYKVYIAGVLVPVTRVVVNSSVGASSTAQLAMPAHPMLLGIGKNDKLQVAIFYLDSDPTTAEFNWNLMFEGYLAGTSYAASAVSREITAFCLSNINILDNLYLEFLGGKGGGKVGKPDKLAPNQITMRGRYPRRLFTKNLDNKVYITRPFDFLGNILLATTGRFLDKDISKRSSNKSRDSYVTKLTTTTKAKRKADLKSLKLLYSNDPDRLGSYYKSQIKRLIKLLDDAGDRSVQFLKLESAKTFEQLELLLGQLDSIILKKSTEDFLGKRDSETRLVANTGFFSRYFNLTKMEQHIVASPMFEGTVGEDTSKLPSGIFPLLRTSRGKKYVRAVTRQTGSKYGQAGSTGSLLKNIFSMMNYEVLDVVCPPIFETDSNGLPKDRFKKSASTNRIAQYITKPISYYSLPPMFNAIFPCMVRDWSVSYQYDAAPTRVYYNRRSQGNKLNTKSSKKGYADSGSFVGYPAKITRHAQDASNSSSSSLEVLVFPEEYYRGPKPAFAEINPLLYQIKTLENSRRLGSADPRSKEDLQILSAGSIPGDQVNMLEEALLKATAKGDSSYSLYVKQAQVDYESARSASVNLSANLIFNPNLVAGFSSVLFDSEDSNCHMVGHINSITHTLAQGTALTSVTLSNTRKLEDMLTGILNQGVQKIMHPLEPLSEIREVLQTPEVANLYYGELFYQGSIELDAIKTNKEGIKKRRELLNKILKAKQELSEMQDSGEATSEQQTKLEDSIKDLEEDLNTPLKGNELFRGNFILNWPKYLSVVNSKGLPIAGIRNSNVLDEYIGVNKSILTNDEKREVYISLLRGFLVQNKELYQVFNNLALAMKLVRRPICTLEEYIEFYAYAPDFINPESINSGGRGRGTRAKRRYLDSKVGVAPYYDIIREFVSGPGVEPGATISLQEEQATDDKPQLALELKYRTGDQDFNIIERVFTLLTEGSKASIQDLPDLAGNTQELLLLYADIIRSRGEL